MAQIYKTGQFAKLAKVSERTIRYYDEKGLLKPSFIMENGYRCYGDEDLVILQKIIALKYLGFSLLEIKTMLEENHTSMNEMLEIQISLLDRKMQHMASLKESLQSAKDIVNQKALDWGEFADIMKDNAQDEKIKEHYRNANNLAIRIQLHEIFSTNKQGWYAWLYSHINFQHVNRLLEVGCGNGAFWKNSPLNIRNREVFLSDISEGMVDTARKNVKDDFSFMVFDCQKIPFKKGYFDAVLANHMLFYVNDIHKGMLELQRVLKNGGTLYCSTYGKHHMQEISDLAKGFDERITLSDQNLAERFGLENGEAILQMYFTDITLYRYEDSLQIDEVEPLLDYIMSCHGNQNELLINRLDEFKAYLHEQLQSSGVFHIQKEAGLFVCHKR